jgi:uncharacterized protein YbbC (DUF1343 family)
MSTKVATGLDILAAEKCSRLAGQKIALLCHAASVASTLEHAVDILHSGAELVRLFAPEHGIAGAAQDMVEVRTYRDKRTGVEVVSLYGGTKESLTPRAEDLSGINTLVVDLPDVGSRYYTYAQTMALAMAVAGRCGVKVLVLDRPNPITGAAVEGCGLEHTCRSFCGFLPIPQRHGLTMGELAQIYRQGFGEGASAYPPAPCDLEVIKVSGWKRTHYFD